MLTAASAAGAPGGGRRGAYEASRTPPMTTRASETMASSATGGKSQARRSRRGLGGLARAHWVATLVMMISVATCISPVIPAV